MWAYVTLGQAQHTLGQAYLLPFHRRMHPQPQTTAHAAGVMRTPGRNTLDNGGVEVHEWGPLRSMDMTIGEL